MKFEPFDYQQRALDFLARTPRAALNATVGAGKSAIILTHLQRLMDSLFITGKALIVAPLNVALNTYPDELTKWDHLSHLDWTILHGSNKNQLLHEGRRDDIHVINYEGLNWLFRNAPEKLRRAAKYSAIVFDESHKMKSRDTQRFKLMKLVTSNILLRYNMTGTPIGNTIEDLWSQYYLLDRGTRLMRFVTHFRNHYMLQVDHMGYKWVPKRGALEAVTKKVADITFRVETEELNLPDLTESRIDVNLPAKLRADYNTLEANYFLPLERGDIEAFNAMTLAGKLRQFAAGFAYTTGGAQPIHKVKLHALEDRIAQAGEPVMIVANFRAEFHQLESTFPGLKAIYGETRKKDDSATIAAWNRGEVKLLAIQPQSAGLGLNLQFGGRRQIWLSPSWSYLDQRQTVGRLYRKGQDKNVLVDHIIVRDTIEEDMHAALQSKAGTAKEYVRQLVRCWRSRTSGDQARSLAA